MRLTPTARGRHCSVGGGGGGARLFKVIWYLIINYQLLVVWLLEHTRVKLPCESAVPCTGAHIVTW